MKITNLFAQLPNSFADEQFEELVSTDRVKIERIVSHGHGSPPGFWYDQAHAEWVLVLKGSAGLTFYGRSETLVLKPGDAVNIGAHQKHRVEWTDPEGPTIWLAVHY